MTETVIEQHNYISLTGIVIEQLAEVLPQPGTVGEQTGPCEQQPTSSGLFRETDTVMELRLQQPELSDESSSRKVKVKLSANLLQLQSERN